VAARSLLKFKQKTRVAKRNSEGGIMIRKFVTIFTCTIMILAVAVAAAASTQAQDERKLTVNVGGGFGVPVAGTSNYVDTGGNVVAGGGYNLTRIIGVTGEFMWQGLPVKDRNRFQIGAVDAHSNLYSVTGNLKLTVPTGGKIGAYAIGGRRLVSPIRLFDQRGARSRHNMRTGLGLMDTDLLERFSADRGGPRVTGHRCFGGKWRLRYHL
jgi:hypothetical protein